LIFIKIQEKTKIDTLIEKHLDIRKSITLILTTLLLVNVQSRLKNYFYILCAKALANFEIFNC